MASNETTTTAETTATTEPTTTNTCPGDELGRGAGGRSGPDEADAGRHLWGYVYAEKVYRCMYCKARRAN
jgi:hypothetical protein